MTTRQKAAILIENFTPLYQEMFQGDEDADAMFAFSADYVESACQSVLIEVSKIIGRMHRNNKLRQHPKDMSIISMLEGAVLDVVHPPY